MSPLHQSLYPTSGPDLPLWLSGVPTIFTSKVHPNVDQLTKNLNEFFLKYWLFPTDNARQKFVGADFAYSSCVVWPDALDERMAHACWLCAILFLVDGTYPDSYLAHFVLTRPVDILDDLSLEDGKAYNDMVLMFFSGKKEPNRDVPIEWITYDIGQDMRTSDLLLFPQVVSTTAQFMRAQTDKRRSDDLRFKDYMIWRVDDVAGP